MTTLRKFMWGWTVVTLIFVMIIASAAIANADDEITLNFLLKVKNEAFDLTRVLQSFKVNQTGRNMTYGIVDANTTTNVLPLTTNVVVAGYAWMRDVGSNNIFVSTAQATNAPFLKLLTNEAALFPLAATSVTYWCTSGVGRLEYWINER